jgi:hypothetical protein
MAGLTTTQTFSDGDTVTAAKLNNIISNCSIDDDAITTVKIDDDAVTLAQMADNSVDTGQLVADSVENSKLNDMAAKTVKANATNAGANPTDVPVAVSELLAGTSTTINAVSIITDLEMVDSSDAIVTDSTATKIRVADTLISGKSAFDAAAGTDPVVPANDTVLVYDTSGTGNKLRKATVTNMMQTLPAVETTSGVVRLATTKRSVDPTTAGTVPADVLTVNNASPMLAKAWVEFTYGADSKTGDVAQTITNSFNITSVTRDGEGIYNIIFGNGLTDTKFDLPSDKYIVSATGYDAGADDLLGGFITSKASPAGSGCTVKFGHYNNVTTNPKDPDGVATLIFYGLTS